MPNNADTIRITGLKIFARHGVLAEERQNGQDFFLDITLQLDLSVACTSDSLDDTVNYDAVCIAAHDTMTATPRNLIEAAAEDVAGAILREFPAVERVAVRLHKPNAPLTHPAGCVSVEISRERE